MSAGSAAPGREVAIAHGVRVPSRGSRLDQHAAAPHRFAQSIGAAFRHPALRIAVIGIAFLIGLAVVLLRHRLLPARFFYDSEHIQRIAAHGSAADFANASFGNVAALYRILGLAHNELLVGLLSFVAASALVVFALLRARYVPPWTATVLAICAILLSSVYLGTYSKDVLVLAIAFAALRLPVDWRGEVALVVITLLYAHSFRSYWALIAALYVVFRIAQRFVGSRLLVAGGPIVVLVLIALAAYVLLDRNSDFARDQINQYRMGSADAQTMITPFVDWGRPWSAAVNTVLVLLTLIVPLPLLFRGSAYYLGTGACFVAIWMCFFSPLRSSTWKPTLPMKRTLWLVLATVTTQALFEPDYGSVLRHLTPMLSVLVAFVVAASDARRGATEAPLASPGSGLSSARTRRWHPEPFRRWIRLPRDVAARDL